MSSILVARMTSLEKHLPRTGLRFMAIAAVATTCLAAAVSHATDLRGRIEVKSKGAVTVEVRSPISPHAPLRKAVADRDGRYYIPDIPPGRYELVVNGIKFPISVEQMAIQELPPIQLKS
jgi:hypothetical protein